MSAKGETFISLDLETTGLNPSTGRILEVGYVGACWEDGAWCRSGGESFLCPIPEALLEALCSDRVKEMHVRSGLWHELTHGCHTDPEEGWERLRQRLMAIRRSTGQGATLVGFNPSFDLGWLQHHRPEIARLIHYRMVDVGCYRRLWPTLADQVREEGATYTHRALDDARFALTLFRAAMARAARTPQVRTLELTHG